MKFVFPSILIFILGCQPTEPSNDYVKEIDVWKKKRLSYLKGENGYVNLAGLFWLKEGTSTFGSNENNDLLFPKEKSEPNMGTIELTKDSVIIRPQSGIEIRSENQPVQGSSLAYFPKIENTPTYAFKSLRWSVIRRGDEIGIRLRDLEHPNLTAMDSISFFKLDPSYRLTATFEPYDPPKFIKTANVLGMVYNAKVPGILTFDLDGQTFNMEPNVDGNLLHLRFTDETTGNETYGLGRYLHIQMPDEDNRVIVDFNKAYNPPCAFTEFATCPIPPKENHFPLKLLAGEKTYGEH